MRNICIVFMFLSIGHLVLAEDIKQPVPIQAPVVAAPAPAPVLDPVKQASEAQPVTVKDENAAPPAWVQDVVVTIKKLPVIGPIAVKVLNWIAVLCSVLTALAAFMMVALKALSSVVSLTELTGLADKIQKFQNGKFMFYLKYASMFNAKKPLPQANDQHPPVMS